uniref:SGNH hydrolase-type esterase domain-containing protein n=1 Tax=Neolamprologus brichardi TaxID=32507 RepID=A0A3Q4MVE8_NEOBR
MLWCKLTAESCALPRLLGEEDPWRGYLGVTHAVRLVHLHLNTPRCRGEGVSDGQQPPVAPPLSTLVLGDSIVRNVRMRGALTLSFPGATVVDIVDRIPNILASHPQANQLIIYIGTNDIPKQQTELLKLDFLQLVSLLGQFCVSCDSCFSRLKHLFGADRLHLNAWGRRLLSANLLLYLFHF